MELKKNLSKRAANLQGMLFASPPLITFALFGLVPLLVSLVLSFCSLDSYNIFDAKTENLKVNLMCGMREEPYSYDGISNKKCEFGVLTVIFKNSIQNDVINFKLETLTQTFEGQLERNYKTGAYMADIEKILENDEQLNLSISGYEENITLACQNKNWAAQYQQAFEIGLQTLGDEVNNFFENKKFKAEAYLKIIYDEEGVFDKYFWYFGIVGQNGSNLAVIIDTNGKVINA